MKSLNFLSLAVVLMLLSSFTVLQVKAQSEWTDPLSWDKNVNDVQLNVPVKQTLLIEGFDDSELSLTRYEVTKGKHDFFYPNEVGIKGASASKSIRLYPGTALDIYIDKNMFDPFSNKWELRMTYAVQDVNKADVFKYSLESAYVEGTYESTILKPSANHTSYDFSQKKGTNGYSYLTFSKVKPIKLSFTVAKTSTSSTSGYYCIDSLMVKMEIPPYTKWKGEGDWNDYKNWSHFFPQGKRNALVQGSVSVHNWADCNQLIAYQPNIQVTDKGRLTVNRFTVVYPFAAKGKWFFVSFPFDVYKSDIDKRFTLGDASTITTEEVNNVLYLMEYDSHRRVTNPKSSLEWKCIDVKKITDDEPIIQKGKGYLMALDETAGIQEVCFTSQENVPLNYTPEAVVTIEADELQGGKTEDNGWILCGNPYPSVLSLQDIEPNPALDGNVYVYDGNQYKPYAIGSCYQLPPFSAFFVKARRTTELSMKQQEHADDVLLRSVGLPYSNKLGSPQVTANEEIVQNRFNYRLIDGKIELPEMKSRGRLVVYDICGRTIQQNSLVKGYNSIPLPRDSGVCIIYIETKEGIMRIKQRL